MQTSNLLVTSLAIVCAAGLLEVVSFGQPAGATNEVRPTVTVATGDVGGKFFGRAPDPSHTRHYYIAAEPVLWDYAPLGSDVVCGMPLPPAVLNRRSGGKIRYIQYTDETFQSKVITTPRLGILGPVLRGVTGDFLEVTFLNHTTQPLSMHPHGVKYDKDSEGSYYQPTPGLGAAVAPGAKFTYVWKLDEESGPLPGEPSSKGWLYHSHVHGDEETALGLIGFIIVTDPQRARPNGTPRDVDREMAALFMIFDESGLGALEKEAAEYARPGGPPKLKTWAQIQEMTELGNRYAINGYIYGNLPGLEMNEGERVRWYLFGLGSEQDFHTAHWHGLRVIEEGRRRTDVVELLPASMKIADMEADNPGSWLFHCHVAEHMMEGMFARFVVYPKGGKEVGRSPEFSFFGLPQAEQSLKISEATATLGNAPNAPQTFELKLRGGVSVYEAFSVFAEKFEVRIGGKSAIFQPDERGIAETPDGFLRVNNAGQYGVLYGGLLNFELTLKGQGWLAELKKLGLVPPKSTSNAVPITLKIGRATHTANISINLRMK